MIGWYECMTTHSDACILLALCMVDILGCGLKFQKLHAHTSKFSAWTLCQVVAQIRCDVLKFCAITRCSFCGGPNFQSQELINQSSSAVHLQRALLVGIASHVCPPIHEDTAAAAVLAARYWVAHDFVQGNWWWNWIGTPRAVVKVSGVVSRH